jgi:hypothetical protein
LAEDDPDLHGAGLSSTVPRREHGAALLAVNETSTKAKSVKHDDRERKNGSFGEADAHW